VEFIALLSMMMALGALSIDMMLPAFGEMRESFGLAADSNRVAGVVTSFLLGLALAQVFYGPLADSLGRKPMLYVGYGLFAAGAIGAALAPSLGLVFAGRVAWGAGAAGPRVIALTIVRDRYEGRQMARVMSYVMAIFVLVPITAPGLGALVIAVAPWRWVFWFCVLAVCVLAVWSLRLPETLKPEYRLPLRWDRLLQAARIVLTTRITLGYTLAMVFAFGAFLSYLASSEIIFSDVFDLEDEFPFIFGGVAALMGAAMLLNSRIVEKVGPRRLVHTVQVGYVTAAGGLLVLALATGGTPPFWVFLAFLATMLVCHALLLPNINAVAMDPVGAVAGTASALIGTISTAGGAVLGLLLDRAFDGTVLPHAVGFLIYGAIGLGIVAVTERGRLFVDREAQVTA